MESFLEYIKKYKTDRVGISLHTDKYIKFLESATRLYDWERILSKSDGPIYDYQDIYEGFSRIGLARFLNASAALKCNGVKTIPLDKWMYLMECLLEDISLPHEKSGVEFLILEISLALLTMENHPDYPGLGRFLKFLAELDPYEKYDSTLKKKAPHELHNFCMYGICAEYLRSLIVGCNPDDFIERHWEIQRVKFNGNGMYMDPGNPMVYDITSRYRLALMISHGYKGSCFDDMMEVLQKGSMGLLFMISSDYKFPYGGRSNQYQFNEALLASLCEFYCNYYKDISQEISGMFRVCAGNCIANLDDWMKLEEPRHIKNLFPVDSNYGTDGYGNYDRYMITAASFITGAISMGKEEITGYVPPNEHGGFVYITGPDFHKVFASCSGYSVEIDTAADPGYDASGLGRICHRLAPYGLAHATPFASSPAYRLGGMSNTAGRSTGVFWYEYGKMIHLAEAGGDVSVEIISEDIDLVSFSLDYRIEGRGIIKEKYSIGSDGVSVKYSCDFAELGLCVPILETLGEEEAVLTLKAGGAEVHYRGWVYRISFTPATVCGHMGKMLYNRNGVYREMVVPCNSHNISANFRIRRENS